MPGPADPRGWIRTARVKRTTIRAVWIANRPGALLTRVVGGSDDGQLLEVSVESFSAGVRIIRARGELGQGSSRWLDRIVDDELAAAPQLLIIEVSGLAKLLSTVVSALVRAAFHAGEADIALCLVGAGRTDIAWQLEATGWLDLFEIHDTVGAAITEIG